jgi:glycosyltransferase involved in cell wall biosynthesis
LQLRRVLLEQRIDVLHTHGFKADVLGYLSTRKLPIRLVSTIHGWSADEGFRIKAYEAISRRFLRRFDRVYPLSPALLHDLKRRNFDPRKLQLILNAVDLSSLKYTFHPRGYRDPFCLLFVGRICRPKGIFDLLQAFAQARFTATAKLVIIGDGPDKKEVEQFAHRLRIAPSVRLVGAVPSITPYLEQSHGLVLPSYSEGIPRTVMEAFAAGVPVIGTAIAGIKQLVDNESTGMLVPLGNTAALARAMERLCANPHYAEGMATRARQVVVERFSAGRMAAEYEGEYLKLCRML